MNRLRYYLGWLACIMAAQVGAALAATVHVFAAASLTDCLKDIASSYEQQSGDKIVFNFGASSLLARQIEEGAPADLFFSADESKMDSLEKKGLLIKDSRKSRLSNSLVIVVAADSTLSIKSPSDLAGPGVKRLALADTKTVPAGLYAKEYLMKAGLWNGLEKKVVPTDNVRAALAVVESGNAQAGIVYKTDVRFSPRVKVAYEIPIQKGPAISYPMAMLKEAREPEAAARLLKHLNSKHAARVFEKHSFTVLK